MIANPSRTARKAAVTFAAVAALFVQSLIPHVHAWHGRPTSPVRVAAAERCTVDCPTTLRSAATEHDGDADQHSPATCPLCRAQNDARSSLLPPAYAVPLPAAAPTTLTADPAVIAAAVVRSVAAPRAPPLAS